MPSNCSRCRELADRYAAASSDIQSIVGAQKLSAMRHDFAAIPDCEPRLEAAMRRRSEIYSEILTHASDHRARAAGAEMRDIKAENC